MVRNAGRQTALCSEVSYDLGRSECLGSSPASLNSPHGRQWLTPEEPMSLSHIWETQMGFGTPGFSLVQDSY